jgi:hypothetical protein
MGDRQRALHGQRGGGAGAFHECEPLAAIHRDLQRLTFADSATQAISVQLGDQTYDCHH